MDAGPERYVRVRVARQVQRVRRIECRRVTIRGRELEGDLRPTRQVDAPLRPVLGRLLNAGDELGALATVFVSRDEAFELRAGAGGLEVLVLQFPVAAASSFVEAMARPTD